VIRTIVCIQRVIRIRAITAQVDGESAGINRDGVLEEGVFRAADDLNAGGPDGDEICLKAII